MARPKARDGRASRARPGLGPVLRTAVVLIAAMAAFGAVGCEEDQLISGRCDDNNDCTAGQRCEQAGLNFHRCVPTDAAVDDGGADRPSDLGASDGRDLGAADRPDGAVDRPAVPDAPVDMGPVRCSSSTECQSAGDPNRPLCAGGLCVGCQTPNAGTCGPAHPLCDPTSGACVDCSTSAQCSDPALPYCVNQRCVSCADGGGDAGCKLRDPARPICGTAGKCAECSSNDHCKAAPDKAFCTAGTCVGCQLAAPTVCTGTTPLCNPTTGVCGACLTDSDCKLDTTPACVDGHCASCALAPPGKCASIKPNSPTCGPTGACVECLTSADCTLAAARPICNTATHVCRPCTADNECAARGPNDPGICLDNRGGTCATEAEVIVVSSGAGCGAVGNRATPLCLPQDALGLINANRAVVAIHGTVAGFNWILSSDTPALTVVGKETAVIAGGAQSSIRIEGPGDVLVRGVTVRSCDVAGVVATAGATLRLRDAYIEGNRGGGILLDGAHFEIRNTTVVDNGPGLTGATSWGGILALSITGTPARLDNVSIKNNKQVGLACAAAVAGAGVYAKNNAGGIDVQDTCAITTCDPESATCGAGAM
jgi:hypothetical protein